jgi:hypothetical protein
MRGLIQLDYGVILQMCRLSLWTYSALIFSTSFGWRNWIINRTSGFAATANKPSYKTQHRHNRGLTVAGGSFRHLRKSPALFRPLVRTAALRWNDSPESQTGMEREFRYGSMNSAQPKSRSRLGGIGAVTNRLTIGHPEIASVSVYISTRLSMHRLRIGRSSRSLYSG